MIREELARLMTWNEHHRRLFAHLVILIGATLVVDLVGTALVYVLEHNAKGTEVHTVFEAFFFTTVQVLTVSSHSRIR